MNNEQAMRAAKCCHIYESCEGCPFEDDGYSCFRIMEDNNPLIHILLRERRDAKIEAMRETVEWIYKVFEARFMDYDEFTDIRVSYIFKLLDKIKENVGLER